jgi:hypothetical protein
MKKFLTILMLLGAAYSQTYTIVKLNPGSQAPPIVTGKSYVKYVPNGGKVIFTSSINLGNTSHITFDGSGIGGMQFGFGYSGTGFIFEPGVGNNLFDSLKNWDFTGQALGVFDGDPSWPTRLLYKGTPSTALFWGLAVDTFRIAGKTMLYAGTYQNDTTFLNVDAGFTANHGYVILDSTSSVVKVSGNSHYGFHFDNWQVCGMPNDITDVGVIMVVGSGQILNWNRYCGYGYVERISIAHLAGIPFDQTVLFKSCIDATTIAYGTVDTRIDPTQLKSTGSYPISGDDLWFTSNTSANKNDIKGTYVTNAVVAYSMTDQTGKKFKVHLDSNFAANAFKSSTSMDAGSSLFKNADSNPVLLDSFHNIDLKPGVPVPPGLIDSNYYPIPGSILASGGYGAQNPFTVSPCPICPKVDSVGIGNAAVAAYVKAHPCPPPVICPICPPPIVCPPPIICPVCPKQRTAISMSWDKVNHAWLIGYDDGTFSTL